MEGSEGWLRIQIGSLDQRIALGAQPRPFGGAQSYFKWPVTQGFCARHDVHRLVAVGIYVGRVKDWDKDKSPTADASFATMTTPGVHPMPGKRVQFDDETWSAIYLLARDSMRDFQELADEAFRDLLAKHHRPVGLTAQAQCKGVRERGEWESPPLGEAG